MSVFDILARESIELTFQFVPFSKSRNAKEKHKSLNWKVTLSRKGKEFLTVDYSAGCGHCPASAKTVPAGYRARDRKRIDGKVFPGTTSMYRAPTAAEKLSDYLEEWRNAECESGVAMKYSHTGEFVPVRPMKPIVPSTVDVIYSLVMDSGVIDYSDFESWASEYGHEPDSRAAESIYRQCLDIALKLRAAIGDATMRELSEILHDY